MTHDELRQSLFARLENVEFVSEPAIRDDMAYFDVGYKQVEHEDRPMTCVIHNDGDEGFVVLKVERFVDCEA